MSNEQPACQPCGGMGSCNYMKKKDFIFRERLPFGFPDKDASGAFGNPNGIDLGSSDFDLIAQFDHPVDRQREELHRR